MSEIVEISTSMQHARVATTKCIKTKFMTQNNNLSVSTAKSINAGILSKKTITNSGKRIKTIVFLLKNYKFNYALLPNAAMSA